MAQLNALPPTLEPHATHNIDAMIALTRTLLEKGHAYESQGHVLFAVESMADYGKLSNARWTTCSPARGWRWLITNAILAISYCGSPLRMKIPGGTAPGGAVGPAGTWSVRR
jgi:hypothetical protein